MPSFDVAVTLKTEYHRDPNHAWKPNDIPDIDALGSTLPYCEIVVTDKAIASHAVRTGLAERLGTVVLSRTAEIAKHLEGRDGDPARQFGRQRSHQPAVCQQPAVPFYGSCPEQLTMA